jgi:hypothetical protein
LDALGRAESEELMSGSGEPYFVERDPIGRTTKVIYPNTDEGYPEYQYIYEYNDDGSLKQTALYSTSNAGSDTFGPQVYVVQYFYDDAGRLIRKRVVDNTTQENISTRYETEYEYDGMGRTTRERTLQYQAATVDMEVVLRDVQTSYDLGDNPTEIKFYDKDGWAYTLTQSFAQGYQITDVSHSAAADVTVNTSGSFTYDTNNNLTGTKEFDAVRSSAQLAYRGNWTFTYDRANRLKSYTNTKASNVRGNNWYDSKGKVWQRWTDNTSTSQWDNTLKRYVYDGGQLVQEHDWTVIDNFGTWVYTYADIDRDYQRHPGGMTQRQGTAASYTDYYMQNSANAIEYKTERDPASATIARDERTKDFDQLAGATFSNISNLATSNSYIEMYGGGTGGTQAGFDGLMQRGGRHYLAGLGRFTSRMGNNAYQASMNNVISSSIGNERISSILGCTSGACGLSPMMPDPITSPPLDPSPSDPGSLPPFGNTPPPWWPPDWPWPPPPGWQPPWPVAPPNPLPPPEDPRPWDSDPPTPLPPPDNPITGPGTSPPPITPLPPSGGINGGSGGHIGGGLPPSINPLPPINPPDFKWPTIGIGVDPCNYKSRAMPCADYLAYAQKIFGPQCIVFAFPSCWLICRIIADGAYFFPFLCTAPWAACDQACKNCYKSSQSTLHWNCRILCKEFWKHCNILVLASAGICYPDWKPGAITC